MKYFIILLMSLILMSCGDTITEEVIIYQPPVDVNSPDYKVLTGSFLDSACLAGATVTSKPLDDSFMQTIGHYIGVTKNDLGEYDVPVEISENFAEVFADASCHNEVTNGIMSPKRLSAIIDLTASEANNITPMTTIRSPVARYLMNAGFGTAKECLEEAERLILTYMGMPRLAESFTNMSLQNDSLIDSVLVAVNSALLINKNEAEQLDFMQRIAQDIIAGTTVHQAEFLQAISDLPIIRIKNNLESRYALLGRDITSPPFWNVIGAPDYYDDLLTRTPLVTGTFNLDDNSRCSFDQGTFNTFAVPHSFTGIETSRYIALNFTGYISVWTIEVDGNGKPAPGIKLLDIEKLSEIILNDPVAMVYNGFLGDNHGLTSNTDYYIVIRRDEDFTLSKGCGGGRLYTNYTLASDDEGINWIGDNNNADKFFYFSGVRLYLTN